MSMWKILLCVSTCFLHGEATYFQTEVVDGKPAETVESSTQLSTISCTHHCANSVITNSNEPLYSLCQFPAFYNIKTMKCFCKVKDNEILSSNNTYDKLIKLTSKSGYCWKIIQQRESDSVNFKKTWNEYKSGFGNNENFWIGLDTIYQLSQNGVRGRVELTDWDNNLVWAEYSHFKVDSEVNKYTLTVSGHSGTLCDDLIPHSGNKFSTYDFDNDVSSESCSNNWGGGGWWWERCHATCLNCIYYNLPSALNTPNAGDGIVWRCYRNTKSYSFKRAAMMLLVEYNGE